MSSRVGKSTASRSCIRRVIDVSDVVLWQAFSLRPGNKIALRCSPYLFVVGFWLSITSFLNVQAITACGYARLCFASIQTSKLFLFFELTLFYYAYVTIVLQLQRGTKVKNKTQQNKTKNRDLPARKRYTSRILLMYHICSQHPGLVLCVRIPFWPRFFFLFPFLFLFLLFFSSSSSSLFFCHFWCEAW